MIEPEDLILPGNASIHNRLAIDASGAFDQATAEIIIVRLSQLESGPVVGTYDAVHLQQIHARIFQDLFPSAGQFRAPESSSSLDVVFDRLARENRLKGLDRDEWSKRCTEYLRELTAIEPFVTGNELASLELFRQLASENNMTPHCLRGIGEMSGDELHSQLQGTQSNNLRRILMLAVDPCPTARPSRVLGSRNISELIVSR